MSVCLRYFYEVFIGKRRFVSDTGGHYLYLAHGHIDDFIAGCPLDQPDNLPGNKLFRRNKKVDLEILSSQQRVFLAKFLVSQPADFLRYAETVRDPGPHHVQGVLVGYGDHIVHFLGIGLPPTFDAEGGTVNEPGIEVGVGIIDQLGVRLYGGDGVSFMLQPLREIESHAAETEDKDVFLFCCRFFSEHDE